MKVFLATRKTPSSETVIANQMADFWLVLRSSQGYVDAVVMIDLEHGCSTEAMVLSIDTSKDAASQMLNQAALRFLADVNKWTAEAYAGVVSILEYRNFPTLEERIKHAMRTIGIRFQAEKVNEGNVVYSFYSIKPDIPNLV